MSVDPLGGPAYSLPDQPRSSEPQNPSTLPGEEEAGPLYLSDGAERWVSQNVTDRGYVIDWGTREIIDPKSGESHGTIPTTFER